eukprot:2339842-Pleurochrysis_carterae.AAC.1
MNECGRQGKRGEDRGARRVRGGECIREGGVSKAGRGERGREGERDERRSRRLELRRVSTFVNFTAAGRPCRYVGMPRCISSRSPYSVLFLSNASSSMRLTVHGRVVDVQCL